tara:strand:- start:192 stop:686 length:495 start_codon:yes stop_codon:yes gene_type:complete
MIKHIIKDNFLNETDYKNLKNIMLGGDFPYYFSNTVSSLKDKEDLHFFWTHGFFVQDRGVISSFFKILVPILTKLKIKALIRIKANLNGNQGRIVEHQKHIDYNFKHKGALFSLNTCNGFTTLNDGTKIKSVGNRILLFDPSIPHHSSTSTDTSVRANINFNYF